ncbi:fungal-specific transcription factor domain-containing protein [Colletotrichum navitas]|uniref:Fungal-specific transcription factor domain-containing protein n=1 Tax=Colletotrichum navitas TaxID=681940 RepID=A0AAD8PIS2_9PEZI|nr:fungal-specific transcription factor domain-containing protein [Colletotrichum navitas]KAK1563999.1 fungal-specific transcription factor domain-containing protein [Colletotrichum navitas]
MQPKNGHLERFLTFRRGRCSRELPKCSACKPWPGSCDYTRDKPAPTPGATHVNDRPKTPSSTSPSSIEQRLQSIESSLQKLTEAVERVLEATTAKSAPVNNETTPRVTHTSDIRAPKDENTPGLFLGPSHSFSFLKDTSNNIEAALRTSTPFAYQHARSELQFLSTSLTTATVKTEVIGDNKGFFIPSKALGYQLIGTFLEHAPTGEFFFSTPPDDLLKQIVFHPEQVTQKAWVVFFNYIMLAQASTEEENHANQADKFRRNVRKALNHSSIFLEPREINVQALTIMAMHGEDYTSPNLSWMIVGHACRQAEALGLHVSPHLDFESHQRSLSLFWLLFIVDKSCTLAFGRSPFLPVNSYQDVPLPEFSYLLKFQPHTDGRFADSQTPSKPSHFGAHFFIGGIKLAKIMGSIIEFLSPGPSAFKRHEIKLQLEKWYATTIKVGSNRSTKLEGGTLMLIKITIDIGGYY